MIAALTFDCYGTLVDWERGITDFLKPLLQEKGVAADLAQLLRLREDIEFDMIQARYRAYKEVLAESLREALMKFSIPYSRRDGENLAESVQNSPIFGDTRLALEKLKTRYQLAIISNIDNEIIERTKSRIGIKFDVTVTAEDAQAYKPSLRPFKLCLNRLGCKPEQVLHVSSGFRYDIPPAHELGFRTAWINRKRDPHPAGAPKPDYEFGNLTPLAEQTGSL